MKPCNGQLTLELVPTREVENCKDMQEVVKTSKGGKSFCVDMDCWTNCLEVGFCVADRWRNYGGFCI